MVLPASLRWSLLLLGLQVAAGCSDDPSGTDSAGLTESAPGSSGSDGSGRVDDDSGTMSGAATSTATGNDGDSGDDGGSTSGGPQGSAGCGQPAAIPSGEWAPSTVDVGGQLREYFVYLPEGYDPERPYPVVYQFHGCSDQENRQDNNVPVQDYSGADAIHVRGKAVASCWDDSPRGTGVALFDAMVTEVESQWCADPARRFATGYSSGSFMTHRLGCVRGDVLRAVASIAGGQGGNECVGNVAALLIHDIDDPTVNISASEGARDRYLDANGCDAAGATRPTEHPPCEAYAGCDPGLPVVWCQTAGQGHGRQDQLAGPAFWDFLAGLDGP